MIKKLIYFFLGLLYMGTYAQVETDSIINEVKNPPISVHDFYQSYFNIFDSLKVKADTLYLRPVVLEPKTTFVDTINTQKIQGALSKVHINSYEVSIRNKSSQLSYYNAPRYLSLSFDSIPVFNRLLPYDYLHTIIKKESYWTKQNEIGLDISQNSFTNWSAGGNNSISGLLKVNMVRNYENGRNVWNNTLRIRYGLNKQDERETRKTDDVLSLESTYGYQTSVLSQWYYTAKLSVNTQFSNGYAYPNVEKPISKFAAPLYFFAGIGAEYTSKNKHLKTYISPSTLKSTFVFDKALADAGAFGVEAPVYDANGILLKEGKRAKHEFGFLITGTYERDIFKNVKFTNRLNLYTDYLANFGNIDVDWELLLEMKINNFLKATVGGHFVYDDDIKNKKTVDDQQITEGPKLQIKQVVSVGFSYTF